MKLQIDDPKNILTENFMRWLDIQIRNKFLDTLDDNKLKNWDIFFNNQTVYKSIYKKKISTKDILTAGITNLLHASAGTQVFITINPNINMPSFNQVKVKTLCKLINFGNQDISGYPIFTDIFNYFADNLQEYLELYLYRYSRG